MRLKSRFRRKGRLSGDCEWVHWVATTLHYWRLGFDGGLFSFDRELRQLHIWTDRKYPRIIYQFFKELTLGEGSELAP